MRLLLSLTRFREDDTLTPCPSAVRTPLNAIINYLELALDGPIVGEVRDNLVRSHAASKSLIHVINDLLVRFSRPLAARLAPAAR